MLPSNRIAARFALSILLIVLMSAGVCVGSILSFGRPRSIGFTLCPPAFFLSSFFLIPTGGLLGYANLSSSPRQLRMRTVLCLLCGAAALGMEAYGLWCLLPHAALPAGKQRQVVPALILAGAHWLSCLLVLLLTGFASAQAASDAQLGDRTLLKLCAACWFFLGLTWPLLLVAFAAML
jgi:hypothetical protein